MRQRDAQLPHLFAAAMRAEMSSSFDCAAGGGAAGVLPSALLPSALANAAQRLVGAPRAACSRAQSALHARVSGMVIRTRRRRARNLAAAPL